MAHRSRRQRFLAKTRNQHGVIADQVRENYLDGVLRFQKDVTCLEDNPHPSLTQPPF